MKGKTEWFGIMLGSLLVSLVFMGCTTSSLQPLSRLDSNAGIASSEGSTITNQPSWVLIGGKDVPASNQGNILPLNTDKVNLYGFEVMSYVPESDPMVVTFRKDGRITYWKGTGEITKVDTGERVVVPSELSQKVAYAWLQTPGYN